MHMPGVLQGEIARWLPVRKVYGTWAAGRLCVWEAGEDVERLERRLNGLLHFCSTYPPHDHWFTRNLFAGGASSQVYLFGYQERRLERRHGYPGLFAWFLWQGSKHHNQSDSNKANLPVMKSMMLTDLIILIYFSWIFSSGVPFGVYILHLLLPDPAAYQRSICTGVATVICYQFSNRERDKGPNIKPELPFQIYQKNSPFLHRRHWRGWPWSGNLLNKKTLRLGMVGSLALFRGPHFALPACVVNEMGPHCLLM